MSRNRRKKLHSSVRHASVSQASASAPDATETHATAPPSEAAPPSIPDARLPISSALYPALGAASRAPRAASPDGTGEGRAQTITGCILARNEEKKIAEALQSLRGWTDEILVIDDRSTDRTAEVARRHGAIVIPVPPSDGERSHFDALRNLAIEPAGGDWIYYLDADERVLPRLGEVLKRLIAERGSEFEALVIPFKNYFCGKWMEHSGWWPGYTRPQLLKKGCFRYNERLHSGVQVEGRTLYFPCEDADLAIVHYSYDDLHHYLEKLNRYTDGEAQSLLADGASHSWQAQLAHFVHDWQAYYERGRADMDGMHGFVLSFCSAFYRFLSRAKLWDLRRQRNELHAEEALPRDLREMLEFMARVTQQGAEPWLSPGNRGEGRGERGSPSASFSPAPLPLVWSAPLFDPSGFADEARQFVLGLLEAGEPLSLVPARWGEADAGLPPELHALVRERTVSPETPAELYVSHTLIPLVQPSPQARVNIARVMFETDRLPTGWPDLLNRMDRIWVASRFNQESFVRSGVEPDKIAIIPGALDPDLFTRDVAPWPLPGGGDSHHGATEARSSHEDGAKEIAGKEERGGPPFPCSRSSAADPRPVRFLSVFDWTLHKGWDVLLEAFAREFGSDPGRFSAELFLKTWSSNHYTLEQIRGQADAYLVSRLGRGLDRFPNIHIWQELIPSQELPRLYRAVDAFVLPTRGEGWCRPLMEAMAAGLPTIATAWSGLTAFHSEQVGYPLAYLLTPVSQAGAREIPTYRGHCWAEPDLGDLRRLLRRVVECPEEAGAKGQAAMQHIARHYSRAAVTPVVQAELARCRDIARSRRDAVQEYGAETDSVAQRSGANGAATSTSSTGAERNREERRPPWKPKANPLVRELAAPVDFRAALGRPLRVRWEGHQTVLSSLALVNREFCLGLLGRGDVELSLLEDANPWRTLTERDDPRFGALFARLRAPLSGPPDVTIRHHFPPNWERPQKGKLVVIQPWEYGHLPREWVHAATHQADEVWAYSRFVRDVYVRSGVPAEKVRVVPLGFDPGRFTPDGPTYPLPTTFSSAQTRFLFVGGALDRKGADLLLQAYLRAFSREEDDVCLVVKDMGTRSFYYRQTFGDLFRQAAADPRAPRILYLDDDLSIEELASLYRACTCVVLPYRGEGFALPPLEGMACGLPAIVTAGGPTDDYADDETALRVPAHRRYRGHLAVGPDDCFPCVGDPWQLEPDLDALVEALRWVRDHPDEARRRGEAARQQVSESWTWQAAVDEACLRLRELTTPSSGRQVEPATVWAEPTGAGQEQGRPELSLCLIARDEETRIGECLRSIAPYVDEMVVVDTGSDDRTREVALECGARVFEMTWPDSFAEARNRSLDQARGEWIFWMDADDIISSECARGLRELIRRHPRRDAAYQVQVRIPPGPGEFSESLVDHVKLFPNRPDLRFEHRIHEQILPPIRRAGLEVLFSELYVTHQNYDRSEEGQAKKRRRDFRLLELDLRDHPDHPFVLFNLGMTYLHATKEFEVAAHYLRRSLDRSHPTDSIVRKAYAMLTTARICQGEWEAAIQANEEGRRHYAEDAELLFQAGQVYQQLGRFAEGRQALERLVGGREDPHYRSVDVGLRTYRGLHELALLYRRMGDLPHCEGALRQIIAAQPDYLPAQVDLAETLALAGKCGEARRFLERIPAVQGVEEDLQRIRALLGSL